jgi:hypothetical protein
MDDRTLGSALADWLHASDAPLPDAATNVRMAVERAAGSRQWGWAPRRLPAGDVHRRRASGLHLPVCLLYTSPSPRDRQKSRMPSSA